jgi:hypothetical protein
MSDWLLSKMPTWFILLYLRIFKPKFYAVLCRMSVRLREDGSMLVGYGGKFIRVDKEGAKVL